MPVAAAAPFIGPIMGGVGSIMGGIKGAGAANQAGQLQYQAAQQAIQQFQQQLAQVNPQITSAAGNAAAKALTAAQTAGGGLTTAAQNAAAGINTAAGSANALLNPYITAGQGAITNLAQLMAPGGQLTQQFGVQQMQTQDPGYQFRIDQANRALAASAAARGGALGGGTAQALQTQSQNLASSEMQNAFTRWQQQQSDLYNRLSGLAGTGLTAGTTAGGNLMTAGQLAGGWGTGAAQQAGSWLTQGTQYGGTTTTNAAEQVAANALATQRNIADLITGGAAAQAGGVVGGANAWNAALGGVGNAATQAGNIYTQQQLLDYLQNNPGGANVNFTPYANANPWNPNPGSSAPLFVNPAVTIPNLQGRIY